MNDDILLSVDNVSKRFCRSLKRSLWYGLQDLSRELGVRRHGGGGGLPQSSTDVALRKDEFWAVKDISFELRRGESIGLIGKNGAGKTTLLRMLNGLIRPDTGSIKISGKVGALIALGAGFNPMLSGRENIYINSSVLGLTKQEVDNKLSQIINFAELTESIDSPVQTYSSGMQVRLGFSVAAVLEPELLILDEVLAVGDMNFQAKCWNRLGELRKKGCSFIIVSHQMLNIERLASQCLLIDRGVQISKSLDKHNVIKQYEKIIYTRSSYNSEKGISQPLNILEQAGSKRVRIGSVSIQDKLVQQIETLEAGEELRINLQLISGTETCYPVIELAIRGISGTILQLNNKDCRLSGKFKGQISSTIKIPFFPLCNDSLTISIAIWSEDMTELYDWLKGIRLSAFSKSNETGNVTAPISWTCEPASITTATSTT